jgi:hypothetical protein
MHQPPPCLPFPGLDPRSPAKVLISAGATLTRSSPKPPSRTSTAPRRSRQQQTHPPLRDAGAMEGRPDRPQAVRRMPGPQPQSPLRL